MLNHINILTFILVFLSTSACTTKIHKDQDNKNTGQIINQAPKKVGVENPATLPTSNDSPNFQRDFSAEQLAPETAPIANNDKDRKENVTVPTPGAGDQLENKTSVPMAKSDKKKSIVANSVKNDNRPKKNIIAQETPKKRIIDVIQGQWNLQYDGGKSELIYINNGKFTYNNATKKSTFTHTGRWSVYKKHNRWYVRHKGKYLTKTGYGKVYEGAINDLYIIKKLSGDTLILLEAKNHKHIKSTVYDLKYTR